MIYEQGRVAARHPQLIEWTADVALVAMPIPLRILDVGCGDGRLLSELIVRVPHAELYVGVDPLPDLIGPAQRAAEPRLSLVRAAAEALPFADASFDLVLTTMSFEHWSDQQARVRELARVVTDHGKVVLVEAITPGSDRRNRGQPDREVARVLGGAGLRVDRVEMLRRSWRGRPSARAFICFL